MSVRGKLLLALAPLGVALAVLGVLSVVTVQTLGRSSARILQENYLTTLAVQRILDAIENLDAIATLATIGGASSLDAGTKKLAEDDRARLEASLRVQEGNITEPGEAEITRRLRAAWEAYDEALTLLLATAEEAERRRILAAAVRPAYRDLRARANEILALNQDAMVIKGDRTQRAVQRMNTVLVASAIAAFGIGLILSLSLLGRVLRRLERLALAVERVGEHDFQTRVEDQGSDEIAQLGHNFNRMTTRLEEYRRSSLGELLRAQQAAQAAIDSIPDPVLVFASEGVLISANQSAERLLALGEAAGSIEPLARLEPALREGIDGARAHVLAGRGPFSPKSLEDALRVQTRDGEAYLLPRATPVYAEDGSVGAVTVILQDVTRLRRFGELTSDLVATAAHELRTPLTSLRMAIHLCIEERAGPLSPKQADLLYAAREDCERLHDTVNELLDLARLQGGRGSLERRRVELAPLIEGVCARLEGLGREGGVRIDLDLPPFLAVDADPERLEVVLTNLVDNALKHSPPASAIEVRASEFGKSIRIEVRDSGPGIPAEDRPRVFDKFYRLPTAPAGGSGLGLSIAREIVQAHGGEIGVEPNVAGDSGEERGSVFWFTLPTAPPC